MSLNLNGIIAALPTPFNREGEVDHDNLVNNLRQWNQTDLRGYLILGSTGEFPHLTVEEKLAVLRTVRSTISSEKLLIVGTGELSTRQTIEMTRKAADRGADAALVVTPFYYKKILTEEQLAAHYRRVAESAPIPILIYLIPQFSGVYLMPETIAALAAHPNIIGLKESSGDMDALKQVFNELSAHAGAHDFNVLVGAPMILQQALDAGAVGGVLAVACIAPRTCVELERAWRNGDHQRAASLQERLSTLARITTANGIGHLKAAMDLVGLYGFLPRSPLPSPTDAEREEIENAIAASGFFTKSEDGLTWIEKSEVSALEFAG
jgi:4-hydroxy-2-oxoglutarate aldolase